MDGNELLIEIEDFRLAQRQAEFIRAAHESEGRFLFGIDDDDRVDLAGVCCK